MSSHFKHFLENLSPKRKLIFDLDKTLWNCTAQWEKNLTVEKMRNFINPETVEILKKLQANGNSMNIASRSAISDDCKIYLAEFFHTIQFDEIHIFPTMGTKEEHIKKVYKGEPPTDFVMFDDVKPILRHLKHHYPECLGIWCQKPLTYKTFESMENYNP